MTALSTSTSLQAIIRAFEVIARFNTLIKSQRYTKSSILHQHVLKTRRVYQELITCVTLAAEDFRKNDNDKIDDDSEDEDALKGVLSDAARFDSESKTER